MVRYDSVPKVLVEERSVADDIVDRTPDSFPERAGRIPSIKQLDEDARVTAECGRMRGQEGDRFLSALSTASIRRERETLPRL